MNNYEKIVFAKKKEYLLRDIANFSNGKGHEQVRLQRLERRSGFRWARRPEGRPGYQQTRRRKTQVRAAAHYRRTGSGNFAGECQKRCRTFERRHCGGRPA